MSSVKTNLEQALQVIGVDPALAAQALDTHAASYLEMLGFLPPRVQARLSVTGALDAELIALQENIRSHAMATPHLEPKMVQLILFGMLLIDGNDAVQTHGIAARRAGASWDELQAVVSLCFLFRGLPAANRGADTLARVAAHEASLAGQDTPAAKGLQATRRTQ